MEVFARFVEQRERWCLDLYVGRSSANGKNLESLTYDEEGGEIWTEHSPYGYPDRPTCRFGLQVADAIKEAIQQYGDTNPGSSQTEVKVLREWLKREQSMVDRTWSPQGTRGR